MPDILKRELCPTPKQLIGWKRNLRRLRKGLAAVFVLAISLGGCKEENAYVPPPPPVVGVAQPLKQTVSLYLEQTGSAAPVASVDLVARVGGFLSEIHYQDGATVKRGDLLFVIEPTPYEAKLKQAEASLIAAKAELVRSQAEFGRQSTLSQEDVTTAVMLDKARQTRDSDQGAVMSAEAGVTLAKVNLSYTRVTAPFDGIVTQHLVSVGGMVGETGETKLATIVQLEPIHVAFNMSEQNVLLVRANLWQKRLTLEDLVKIPLEVGLMNEEDYPHPGTIDYVAPEFDATTGTLLIRGIFRNSRRELLPGSFVRVRVPMERRQEDALLVPRRALGQDQEGRYVLVIGNEDLVEQRKVALGQQVSNLQVIESGLKADDRVVVTGNQRAIPGKKVTPQPTTITSALVGVGKK
jgi:membrane fusion protein, multidrug efflux system